MRAVAIALLPQVSDSRKMYEEKIASLEWALDFLFAAGTYKVHRDTVPVPLILFLS